MARLHTNQPYSDSKAELTEYKDYRRGALEDAFWDEDELVDYRPSSRRTKPKKKPGCPGNDGNAHVYVWVAYDWDQPPYSRWERHWFDGYEKNVCCGCGKRGKGFRRKN